jgi:hypothetical protein
MKTQIYPMLLGSLLLTPLATVLAGDSAAQTLKVFTVADQAVSKDLVATNEEWMANCQKAQTIRLFELPNPNVEDCMVLFRARIKTEALTKPVYLEMWCRFPGKGEFFSRDLAHALTGSNDWASFETPFFLKKGEQPDLIKLNLVVKGTGKVWIKDIEVLKGQLPTN